MFIIIGGDGKEYGPVSTDQIRAWMAAGRANLETKARLDGTTEWRPLGEFAEFMSSAPPPLIQPRPTMVGIETGGPGEIAAKLASTTGKLDVFSCFDRSFSLWKAHLMPLVGATLLLFVVQIAVNVIPIVGGFASVLLNGVFYGGLYYYYLGRIRGEPRTVGDVFAGFRQGVGSLMLASFLTSILTFFIVAQCFAPVIWPALKAISVHAAPDFESLVTPVTVTSFVIGFILLIYVSVSWIFTFALIIDQGLGAWTAMEVSRRVVSRNWFRVFFLGFLGGLIAMLGLIGFMIGVFFTIPIAIAALMYAYEDLFRPRTIA
jgi:hypothetical protein